MAIIPQIYTPHQIRTVEKTNPTHSKLKEILLTGHCSHMTIYQARFLFTLVKFYICFPEIWIISTQFKAFRDRK